jgi:hypothetical protein
MRSFSFMIMALVCSFFIFSGVVLADDRSNDIVSGELHCYLGIVGIVIVLLSLSFGLLTSGRFGRIKGLKTVPLHMSFSVLTSVFFTGEFLFGVVKDHWFFAISYHSIIGFSTMAVSWVATMSSPCIVGKKFKWKASSKIHAIIAVLLLILVIIQVLNGYLFLEE